MASLRGLRRKVVLRLQRRYLQVRAFAKRQGLRTVMDRTGAIQDGPILFSTVRNEAVRLPFFLDHYRKLGVVHFLIVDNGSDDGTLELLRQSEDVSIWQTTASYKRARFGVDWLNGLLC